MNFQLKSLIICTLQADGIILVDTNNSSPEEISPIPYDLSHKIETYTLPSLFMSWEVLQFDFGIAHKTPRVKAVVCGVALLGSGRSFKR